MMKVLHIISESVYDKKHLFLGSTKDILGRTEYFKSRKIKFNELIAEKRSDEKLLEKLKKTDLNKYSIVFLEYPVYPKSLLFLRKNYPHLKLIIRSFNAEFLQHIHYALAYLFVLNDVRLTLFYLKRSIERIWLDYICAKRADYILTISLWEKEHYWRFLASKTKVICMPFFLPSYFTKLIRNKTKKLQCVTLMSTTSGTLPFLLDAAKNYNYLVEELKNLLPEWIYLITGEPLTKYLKLSKRVKATGFVNNPYNILAESNAVALLSDYGFGFKTKIVEAICHKCYILVTQKLYQRLPLEVRKFCIIVEKNSVVSFKNALHKCSLPYPTGNPNILLKDQAFTVLDQLMFK